MEGEGEWTPERYLQELETFLEANASELYGGRRTLRLHPRGLELLNSKLGTLERYGLSGCFPPPRRSFSG